MAKLVFLGCCDETKPNLFRDKLRTIVQTKTDVKTQKSDVIIAAHTNTKCTLAAQLSRLAIEPQKLRITS